MMGGCRGPDHRDFQASLRCAKGHNIYSKSLIHINATQGSSGAWAHSKDTLGTLGEHLEITQGTIREHSLHLWSQLIAQLSLFAFGFLFVNIQRKEYIADVADVAGQSAIVERTHTHRGAITIFRNGFNIHGLFMLFGKFVHRCHQNYHHHHFFLFFYHHYHYRYLVL